MTSILTLVHNRPEHLDNLIKGLEKSIVAPSELVIVHMNESAVRARSEAFPIITKTLQVNQKSLPLAQARNLAVCSAHSEQLLFLDVDCIPAPTFLADHQVALIRDPKAIHQGVVRYLSEPVEMRTATIANLSTRSAVHPLQADRQAHDILPYALFWSLNFSCYRDTFNHVGGFDVAYTGYGGEDTDFSFTAQRMGVPLRASTALAFHQYHAAYDPPLNHFVDIVQNARVFKAKWDEWPMMGWLQAFEARGYLQLADGNISIIRHPSSEEIRAALV
ncbi:galactosyltransferase-related protein [Robbsia sp. KACC 23696]|uniref:galactosyltransferase-related protein n=1 Tax=Robbsia sp. KACC 23696 TaxID=3149231 RepID=UPI00325AE4BD